MEVEMERKKIEEVKEFSYFGYRMQRNGGQKGHVKERIRKTAAIMGQIWGIEEKKFGND